MQCERGTDFRKELRGVRAGVGRKREFRAPPAARAGGPATVVVGAWIRIVIRIAMKVTEAITCAPGAFMPSSRPASAAGITPVSRVQHMNSISLKLQRARRSGMRTGTRSPAGRPA